MVKDIFIINTKANADKVLQESAAPSLAGTFLQQGCPDEGISERGPIREEFRNSEHSELEQPVVHF